MDQNGKDDLKTQFVTREGTYRLITLSEYSRPNRVGYQSNQNNPQVRVSLLPAKPNTTATTATNDTGKTAFNVGSTVSSTISTNTAATNTVTSNNAKYIPHQSSTTSSSNVAGTSLSNGISDSVSVSQQQQQQQLQQNLSDKICFNFGKELYVYSYRGVKKNVDLCKPIDKKLYKGTSPSCHDFNETTAVCDCAPLLVGFTTGQIQLVQPGKREAGRLYNEERLIDKTKVTCLKWLPKSPNLFLASHSSGHLYLYNEELPCSQAAPNYQNFKSGDGYTILTCKSKSTRNPLYKWTFNTENCSINEFCFSPCGSMLAIVSQDGFLRVFHYDTMELLGIARSYFGGFLCACWSPDSKYVVVGGEDDLVTVWSLNERRVVARGQGHRSWVSVVAFDPYTSYSHCDSPDFSDDENPISCSDNKCSKQVQMNSGGSGGGGGPSGVSMAENIPTAVNSQKSASTARNSYRDSITAAEKIGTSYRLGSVGQDTQLCLWDITEDILRQSYEKRHRVGSLEPQTAEALSHSSKEIAAKLSAAAAAAAADIDSNSNSKLSNFRTKFGMSNSTDGGDTSSSSNNIGHTTATATTTANTAVAPATAAAATTAATTNNSEANKQKHSNSNSFSKLSSNYSKATNVMENCVNTTGNNLTKTDSTTTSTTTTTAAAMAAATSTTSSTTTTATGTTAGSASSGSNSGSTEAKSNNGKSSESGLNPFNTLTQRLSNFNFVNDRKSSVGNQHSHKKTFSKSTGNHTTFLHHSANSSGLNFGGRNGNDSDMISSSKNSKNANNSTAVVSTYDPMKLIGSAACPRFDECPLLEPLVCKKIAHERLTALIFREDCFLTACQDGFIYTWARPGYSNIPQHNISNSPTGATSGTVV